MTHIAGQVMLVLGAGLGMYVSIGIVLIHGFSVFIVPIVEDTGWNRTHIAALLTPVAVVNGFMSPVVGALTDRIGPRRVLLISSMTTGAGLIGIGLSSDAFSSFAIALVVASILGGAQTGVPYTYVIVGWFEARRGLALGVMLSFVGLGIATVPPILSAVIAMWGWRSAYIAAGVATALLTLLIALLIIRDPPVRPTAGTGDGHTLGEAAATSSFWLMLGAFLLNYLVAAAGSISLPVILADRGVSLANAAMAMSLVGATFTVTRLGFGVLLDRFPAGLLTSVVFLAPVIGHLLLAGTDNALPAYVSAMFFGVALGAEGDAMGYLLAQRFGRRSFGKIFGINYFAFTVGAGLGPALLHFIADEGREYFAAFTTFAVLGAVAPVLLVTDWSRSRRRL
ncbi:MAG: hypothetical protein K0R27_3226 [Xanthobacteraceae bacterium]|jgi:MFS family permease|nr:hypothetical protein [Xanthobacteraceae bacterium]